MTVRIPPENILDKILKLFGKEHEVIIPEEAGKIYEDIGPYVQIKGNRESFFKALMRKTHNQESKKKDQSHADCFPGGKKTEEKTYAANVEGNVY